MSLKPHPGYEAHLNIYHILAHGTPEEKAEAFKEQQSSLKKFEAPLGLSMKDVMIPGTPGEPEVKVRIIRHEGLPEKSPVVLDIHGGGFVGGNLDIDNFRNIEIATLTQCIVVSVEYRLAPKHAFPAALLDCYATLNWIYKNADSIGGDKERIGLHGTSAGGNLVAALSLFTRDKGGPKISLAAMVNPVITLNRYPSRYQMACYTLSDSSDWANNVEQLYIGGMDGQIPSYYAFPGYCPNLAAFPPAVMVVSEYDTLRDDGLRFAIRLLEADVPCEMILAPRVGHGFCTVDHPLTRWVHEGICASFRREFGMMK